MVCLAAAAVLTGCASYGAEREVSVQDALQDMIDADFALLRADQELPSHLGIILHLQTPGEEYTVKAGFAGVPVTEHTRYRVASVSKTFTAAAIMLLDQEGIINIDDALTAVIPGTGMTYLPDTAAFAIPNKEQITIRDLLSHRAGVYDLFNDPVPAESSEAYAGMQYAVYIQDVMGEELHQYTLEELAGVLAVNQLSYGPPGEVFHYSDTGYSLLAGIVERASGMSYAEYLQEKFLTPLGLHDTSAPSDARDTALPEPFLEGYTRWDDDYFSTTEDNMSNQVGPGNIISSASDTAVWIRELLSARGPLSSSQIERMKSIPEGNDIYALGVSQTPFGWGHSGAHPGYLNFVSYHAGHDVSVAAAAPFINYNEGNMDKINELLLFMVNAAMKSLQTITESR